MGRDLRKLTAHIASGLYKSRRRPEYNLPPTSLFEIESFIGLELAK